jgi:hypothetical protein
VIGTSPKTSPGWRDKVNGRWRHGRGSVNRKRWARQPPVRVAIQDLISLGVTTGP